MNATKTNIERITTGSESEQGLRHIHGRILPIVNSAARSDEYVAYRQQGESKAAALSTALHSMIDGKVFDDSTENLASAIAQLGHFIQASHELSSMRRHFDELQIEPNNSEKRQMKLLKKEHLVPFNHTLKEIINADPSFTVDGLTSALARSYVQIYSDENMLHPQDKPTIITDNEIIHELRSTINGMRHEVAAETLLTAAGIYYDYHTTAEEDAQGADLYVYIDEQWLPVDIKASKQAEQRAHQKAHEKGRRSYAVWSELFPSDFTGIKNDSRDALSVPFSVAEDKGPALAERIKKVHGNTIRPIGNSALANTVAKPYK